MAEEGGFEPPRALTLAVFKTAAFDRSATLPRLPRLVRRNDGRQAAFGGSAAEAKFGVKPLNAPISRALSEPLLTAKNFARALEA